MTNNKTSHWYFDSARKNLISKVDKNEVEQWFVQENWLRDDTPIFNSKWEHFKSEMLDNDELWSYKFGGALSMRKGYAIVRNGEVINCFQTGMS